MFKQAVIDEAMVETETSVAKNEQLTNKSHAYTLIGVSIKSKTTEKKKSKRNKNKNVLRVPLI